MVLIDTSIWISLYRREKAGIGDLLWSLVAKNEAAVCGHIFVEFLGGFRKEQDRKEFEKKFDAFPFLETSREAYRLAADLLALHPSLGSGDAIIGATAIMNQTPLMTHDKDFLSLRKQGLELLLMRQE